MFEQSTYENKNWLFITGRAEVLVLGKKLATLRIIGSKSEVPVVVSQGRSCFNSL